MEIHRQQIQRKVQIGPFLKRTAILIVFIIVALNTFPEGTPTHLKAFAVLVIGILIFTNIISYLFPPKRNGSITVTQDRIVLDDGKKERILSYNDFDFCFIGASGKTRYSYRQDQNIHYPTDSLDDEYTSQYETDNTGKKLTDKHPEWIKKQTEFSADIEWQIRFCKKTNVKVLRDGEGKLKAYSYSTKTVATFDDPEDIVQVCEAIGRNKKSHKSTGNGKDSPENRPD